MHGFRSQERMRRYRSNGSWRRLDSPEVILKNCRELVVLVLLTTDAVVSWTKIAVWVELRKVGRLGYFGLTEPWTFIAMGRHEHIVIGQRII